MHTWTKTTHYRIPTDAGDVVAWCNDDRTIGVRTEWKHNRRGADAPVGGWDGLPETITVNRVEYSMHGFLRLDDNGEPIADTRYGGMIRRVDNLDRGSDAAQRKAADIMQRAVAAWIATDEGAAALAEGQRVNVNNALARLEEDIDKTRAALADLERQHAELSEG